LLPGLARSQGDGWENRRRRHGGNDWFAVELAVEGVVTAVEVDTTHFKGNAPGEIMVTAGDASHLKKSPGNEELVAKQRVQPDTPHRYIVKSDVPVNAVRLDVFPDGGLGRFRVWGVPTQTGLSAAARRWWNSLPEGHRSAITLSSEIKDLL
jgi:allantoicase